MSKYAWPALFTVTEKSHKLTFPDWPDISVQSENQQDAYNQAKDALIHNVRNRIELKSDIPGQSVFGFNNIWIEIDADTSARLNKYLKEQKWEHIREPNALWESIQLQRAAYLTEHRANIEPIERICENADRGAIEFASIGVRFCYILNAGGLVVIPAIMELLREKSVEGPSMLGPAVLFAFGIFFAAIANYLAYHFQFKLGESWSDELKAKAKEVGGNYYPPNDQVAHRAEIGRYHLGHTISLKSANSCRYWGVGAFGCSIILFIAGVACAICGIR